MNKKLQQYHIRFSAVWDVEELLQAFYTFCQKELNSEALDFIIEVNKLTNDEKLDAKKQATFIMNEFISHLGRRQINISAQNKKQLQQEFQSTEDHEVYKFRNMFVETKKIVLLELENDVFPRFIRSDIFKKVIVNHLNNKRVATLKTTIQFPYTDEDFFHHMVYNKDIAFMHAMCEDNYDWELIGRTGTRDAPLTTYWNKNNYMPNVSFFRNCSVVKYEAIFPYSFEKVMYALVPSYHLVKIDANVYGYHDVRYLTAEEVKRESKVDEVHPYHPRTGCVTVFDVGLPFPMNTPRKYPIASTMEYNPEKEMAILVHKPYRISEEYMYTKKGKFEVITNKKTKKVENTKCIVMIDAQCYRFQKLDENRTHFIQIHVFDLGGFASSRKMQKLVVRTRGEVLRRTYMKHLSEIPDDVTIQSKAEELRKDNFGRLLADLPIQQLQMERRKKSIAVKNSF